MTRSLVGLVACTHCDVPKPLDAFEIRSSNGRPHSWCRECHNKWRRDAYVARKGGKTMSRQGARARTADPGPVPTEGMVAFETSAHNNVRRSDKAFKLAMLAARGSGQEHFVIGVESTPSTAHPIFTPHRGIPMSGCTSAAALCVEANTTEKFSEYR